MVSKFRLVLRSFQYYWKIAILTIIGIAIGTSVITGSLLIGNSVPRSLQNITLLRLGDIDFSLSSPKLFTHELVTKIQKQSSFKKVTSAFSVSGIVKGPKNSVPQVSVWGIEDNFSSFYQKTWKLKKRDVAINRSLANDLEIKKGDRVFLHIYRSSFVPRDTLLARKKREDTIYVLRGQVTHILPDKTAGGFKLDADPGIARNIFINQAWLTKTIKRTGYVNTILASGKKSINVSQYLSLADLGMSIQKQKSFVIQSKNFVLQNYEIEAIQKSTKELKSKAKITSVYLINRIKSKKNEASYAVISAIEGMNVAKNSIYLNHWLAQDLANPSSLDLDYFVTTKTGKLRTISKSFHVGKILKMDNEFVSSDFVPEFEGLTNAKTISDWDVPFDIDLSKISDRDEKYWETYRTAPKAFIALEHLEKMWNHTRGKDSGWITSVLVDSHSYSRKRLAETIVKNSNHKLYGLMFRSIKKISLRSAKGSTDFGGLFIAMNFFILLAAVLLISMLTKLYTTTRANQIGIMRVYGFSDKNITQVIITEGIIYSFSGSMIGVLIGILYAKGIIYLLTTSWIGATGTHALELYVSFSVLFTGIFSGFLVGVFSVYLGAKHLSKFSILKLLKGWKAISLVVSKDKYFTYKKKTYFSAILAITLFACGQLHYFATTIAFFCCGACLLLSGYYGFMLYLNKSFQIKLQNYYSFIRKNMRLYQERKALIFLLFAFASFILIAVMANKNDFTRIDPNVKNSGTGGFHLQARTSFPLPHQLDSKEEREDFDFNDEEEDILNKSDIFSMLFFKGEDISCLNLSEVTVPNILGVSDRFIKRGGFHLSSERKIKNPWELLNTELDHNIIPVIGDANSVMWSLHKGLGETLEITTQLGPVKLKFVGLLHNSILASEIIMSKKNFNKIFPHILSPTYYLIATKQENEVKNILQRKLGMELFVKKTPEILNAFIQVQNTYLMTFSTLGGLGMFLGIFGLIISVIYILLQRQQEFALLNCLGMSSQKILHIIFIEISIATILGLICGAISALIAVYPQLISTQVHMDKQSLILILGAMLLFAICTIYITLQYITHMNLASTLAKDNK